MTDLLEFQPWPKIPRLSKPMVVTEKLDGTNACVVIRELADSDDDSRPGEALVYIEPEAGDLRRYAVFAQSRKRVIRPGDDNYGFAQWVHTFPSELVEGFGVGRHFGEWWGRGINRGYGIEDRLFSPFNSHRWTPESVAAAGLHAIGVQAIPVLAHHPTLDTVVVDDVICDLRVYGSKAAPGFMSPEGVVVFHSASGQLYKRLIEGDDRPKGGWSAFAATIPYEDEPAVTAA